MSPQQIRDADEKEYWRKFHAVRGDLESAVRSNQVYFTINNLLLTNNEVGMKLNEYGDFWTLNAHALQTTFFVSFGKLFDPRNGTISVPKLVTATIERPWLFSKSALLERKRGEYGIQGQDPQWLVEYIGHAWEPSTEDLAAMEDELKPYHSRFRSIYQPLRHRYFAHRSEEDEESIATLFARTRIAEVDGILRFLHTLIWSVQELHMNGTEIDLRNFGSYESYVARIQRRTEEFIRQLLP
jgi:hypothetical protein